MSEPESKLTDEEAAAIAWHLKLLGDETITVPYPVAAWRALHALWMARSISNPYEYILLPAFLKQYGYPSAKCDCVKVHAAIKKFTKAEASYSGHVTNRD